MATELKLPQGTWTNPDNEMVATATSWALLLPAYGVFQRLLSRGFLARGYRRGGVRRPGQQPDDRDGRREPVRHAASAWRISNAPPPARARSPSRTASTPPMSAGTPNPTWAISRSGNRTCRCSISAARSLPNSGGAGKYRGGCSFISTWLINKTDPSAPGHLGAFLARVRQCRHVRRLSGADLPDASRGAQHEHRRADRQGRSRCRMRIGTDPAQSELETRSSRASTRRRKGPTSPRRTRRATSSPMPTMAAAASATCWSAIPVKTACGCRERLPDPRSRGAGVRHRAHRGQRRRSGARSSMPPASGAGACAAAPGAGDARCRTGSPRSGSASRSARFRAGSAQDVCAAPCKLSARFAKEFRELLETR